MAEVVPPVVPTPTPTPTPAPTPPAPDWMSGFSEDQKLFVKNKGYQGPNDLLDSYRNLEKLHGVPADRIVKLPEKMDSPEMRAVWEKLGAPKDAKGYGLPASKDEAEAKAVAAFENAFFEAGIPKTAAEKIMSKLAEFNNERTKNMTEAQKLAFTQSEQNLKKEWGQAFDQNTHMAKEAARALGMTEQQVNALGANLGHDGAMKLFHKLAGAVREADFVGGKPPGGVRTPAEAQQEIKNLYSDQGFAEKLSKGDREAMDKWTNLHKLAYDGEIHL